MVEHRPAVVVHSSAMTKPLLSGMCVRVFLIGTERGVRTLGAWKETINESMT